MRTALKVLGMLLLVALVGGGLIGYQTFGMNRAIEPGATFGKVKAIQTSYVQCFMIDVGDGRVALIDAGMNKDGKEIKAELAARKLGDDAVIAVLLTHNHGDHTDGLAAFPRARVYSTAAEVPFLERRAAAHSPIAAVMKPDWPAVKATDLFEDGATLQLGDTAIKAFVVPGHTPGSVAYLADGVLFLGDSAAIRKDGSLLPAPWVFSEDTAQNQRELVKLAARLKGETVSVLAPAHSGAATSREPLDAFAARAP